jgi:hypothetical protein
MKKGLVFFLIILTLVNLSALATFLYYRVCACKQTVGCSHSPEVKGAVLHETLSLSDPQKQQLIQQQACYRRQTDTLAQALFDCRIELGQCLLKEPTDTVKLGQITGRMDSLQCRMHRQVVQHLLEQKKYLSLQQQEKFFSMILKQCSLSGKSCCPK